MTPDQIYSQIRAAAVAHAIRLGKRPAVGMVMAGKLRVAEIGDADLAAGRFDRATVRGAGVEVEFTITAEDIANAERAINQQRATYREPKLTTLRFEDGKQ